jgi:hypothetical protein
MLVMFKELRGLVVTSSVRCHYRSFPFRRARTNENKSVLQLVRRCIDFFKSGGKVPSQCDQSDACPLIGPFQAQLQIVPGNCAKLEGATGSQFVYAMPLF